MVEVRNKGRTLELGVGLGDMAREIHLGDSVLIDGVCLTATSFSGDVVLFDVASGTAALTTLGNIKPGRRVNVEQALRPTDRFGGHFVSGHVDGKGEIIRLEKGVEESRIRVRAAANLIGQMILRGSVAVNGISLTIAVLGAQWFEISLIPHTMLVTTLDSACVGDHVNIECDMIGKWVMRLTGAGAAKEDAPETGGLTFEKIRKTLGD